MKTLINNSKLNWMIKIKSLFIAAILVQSCTFKKAERVNHDGAQDFDTSVKVTASATESEKFVKSFDLTAIRSKAQNIKTEAEASQVIQELEATLLKPEIRDSAALKLDDKVLEALSLYNFAMIRLFEIAPNSAVTTAASDKYQKLALESCNDNLENCSKINWLRRDPRSSRVLELIATELDRKMPEVCNQNTCEAQLKQYYDLVSVAFSTVNTQQSTMIKSLFLKRASQYAQFNKDKNKNLFSRHGKIFENIISNHPLTEKNPHLESIVKQFQPWSYSRLKPNSFAFGAEKIFAFAALHMMYDAKTQELTADFRKAIADSQNEIDSKGTSFRQKLSTLKTAGDSALIFKGLKVDISVAETEVFFDEYFYMIDRLYRDHVNIEEVSSIWKGSKKDEKKLVDAMLIYLKVELISQMVATNQYFTKILMYKNMTSDRLFRKTVDESQPLTQVWEKLFSRVDKLSLFLSQQIKGINGSNQDSSNESLKEANKLIRSIKRNTNFLSVYPNMLLLGYFMIHAEAGFKYQTWWGAEIDINPKIIVNHLLDGGFAQPWYFFSGDMAPLNKTEIIYAFYYALNAGAFETFSVIKDDKNVSVLDRTLFFKKALKKTIADYVKEIEDAISAMNQYRNGHSDVANLIKVCDQEKAGNKNYSIPVKFEDLSMYALTGGSLRGVGQTASGFYDNLDYYYYVSAENNAKDTQQTLRARLLDRLVQMKAMKIPLVDNINQLNIAVEKRKQMSDMIDAEIAEIEILLKKYLSESVKMHREVDVCSERLIWMERQRQSEIFKLELEFLASVHDAMTAIRATPEAQKEAKAKELHKALGMGTSESISGESYVFSKYELLNRFKRYSGKLKPSLDVEDPSPTLKETLVSELFHVQFVDVTTNEPFDKPTFVSTGLSKLNSQGSNIIDWFKGVHSLRLYDKKIRSLVSMYRLGVDIGLKADDPDAIKPIEVINQSLAMAKFASIQDHEKTWMIIMNQPELMDRAEYRGLIFDQSETEYRGILDSAYNQITRANSDLDEAARYALDSVSKSSLIFPIPTKILSDIDQNYHLLVENAAKIVCDMNKAVAEVEGTLKQSDLLITYRIENGRSLIYSPAMIDGGSSITLDLRRKQYMNSILKDFFFRRGNNLYKESQCK